MTPNTNTPEQSEIPEEFKEWAREEQWKCHPVNEFDRAGFFNGAVAAYRHLRSQPIPSLEWVKASERLPVKSGEYYLRERNGHKLIGYYKEYERTMYSKRSSFAMWPENFEWLEEESLLPVRPDSGNDLNK